MWIQISAGRGPAECQRAAWLYAMELVGELPGAEILEIETGVVRDSALSVLLRVNTAEAGDWEGSILWICPSPYRPGHGRKNWFISAEAWGEPVEAPADLSDLVIETFRASGPGGQNVNKVETAVRITHRPTGLSVVGREERTQARNRSLALARLERILSGRAEHARKQVRHQVWQQHNQLERGNPIRTYHGLNFQRRDSPLK